METIETFCRIYRRESLPDKEEYLSLVKETVRALGSEPEQTRPRSSSGLSGGFVRLNPRLSTVVLPDLHARMDFFLSVLKCPLPGGDTIFEALSKGKLQMLCLGDGFHAEARAADRWKKAFAEYTGGYKEHAAMDAEMRENLGLMEMVMRCKLSLGDRFHFLKGNHENILNEEGEGNHPFGKFVQEGAMVIDYVDRFFGDDFAPEYAEFEKRLPVFAAGARFAASHAEPSRFFSYDELVNARQDEEVVLGLTWTDNDAAEPGTVEAMLAAHVPDVPGARYLGGHRAIPGLFRLREEGKYVQIHNPERFVAAWVMPQRDFDPESDVGEIGDFTGE